MYRALLLFLLFVFLARAVWRFLGGVVQGAISTGHPDQRRQRETRAVKMARDPVCGTYVVPGKALEASHGGETMYFCSERCRDEWARSRSRS
jgi:uncharacterized protein